MRILGLLLGLAVICSNANAAILLSIGNNGNGGSFAAGSGPISVDVFVRSTAAESSQGLEVSFNLLNGGAFSPVPGAFNAGFFGAGNITAAGSSFVRSNATTSVLSIEFTASQLFPAADARIATLSIDTTGLAAGTYGISTTGFFTEAFVNTAPGGTFSIVSAVPEPTSIALLGVVIGGVFGRRVLKSRKRIEVA